MPGVSVDLTGTSIGHPKAGRWLVLGKAPAQNRIRMWTAQHQLPGQIACPEIDLPQTTLQEAIKGKASLAPCAACTPAAKPVGYGFHVECRQMHPVGAPCPIEVPEPDDRIDCSWMPNKELAVHLENEYAAKHQAAPAPDMPASVFPSAAGQCTVDLLDTDPEEDPDADLEVTDDEIERVAANAEARYAAYTEHDNGPLGGKLLIVDPLEIARVSGPPPAAPNPVPSRVATLLRAIADLIEGAA